MSMLDMLQQRLGGDAVKQISAQLGTDPGTTQTRHRRGAAHARGRARPERAGPR